jgi:hypothetical protein
LIFQEVLYQSYSAVKVKVDLIIIQLDPNQNTAAHSYQAYSFD